MTGRQILAKSIHNMWNLKIPHNQGVLQAFRECHTCLRKLDLASHYLRTVMPTPPCRSSGIKRFRCQGFKRSARLLRSPHTKTASGHLQPLRTRQARCRPAQNGAILQTRLHHTLRAPLWSAPAPQSLPSG